MDMYPKREMRKKKVQANNNEENVGKTNINWVIPTLVNSDTNPLFIRKSRIFLLTY